MNIEYINIYLLSGTKVTANGMWPSISLKIVVCDFVERLNTSNVFLVLSHQYKLFPRLSNLRELMELISGVNRSDNFISTRSKENNFLDLES